jgi:hypothetical protein
MTSRIGLIALLAVGLALIGWAIFLRESDEEAIRRRLDAISAAVFIDPSEGTVARALKVKGGFDESIARDAAIAVPEIDERLDREALMGFAIQAPQRWSSGALGWEDVVVKVEQGQSAHVNAVARLGGSGRRGQGDEQRRVALDLRKVEGDWVVTSISVEDPEATADEE